MERSPSAQLVSTSPPDDRNGSIFRRMYNSLHRPKKGSDPLVDIADRLEQEKIREQRKREVQQRPDHGKQKQHHTIDGTEGIESSSSISPRSQSWRGDTLSQFEWEPITTKGPASVTATASGPPQLQSASESYISMPTPASNKPPQSAPKPLSRGHSLTSGNVVLPPPNPSPSPQTHKRFSLLTEPPSSTPTTSTPDTDIQPLKTRPEKSKSVPPKPNSPAYKEFRPEKKERVDMDELRLSYEKATASDPLPAATVQEKPQNGHQKRNPSRNSVGPDKPMNGVVAMVPSSRLPSTILPGLQLLPTDEIRKAPLNRPRHPYIPKKEQSSGSLFSGTLRSGSTGKYAPRKQSPSPADPNARGKTLSISIKGAIKKKNESSSAESDGILEPKPLSPGRSPTSYDLPRSHTETLTGVYGPSFRRQRSHVISTSPPNNKFIPPPVTAATSPIKDRPASPSSLTQSIDLSIDGFVSIRRKPKARSIKDSLTPQSRSLLKSKAAEVKKMQQQVVTAKDLAAFSTQPEGKIKLEMIFDQTSEPAAPPHDPLARPASSPSRNKPSSPSTSTSPATPSKPSSPPRLSLSPASSPASIPLPPPLPSGTASSAPRKAPLYPKSASTKISATPPSFPPSPSLSRSPPASPTLESTAQPPPSPKIPVTTPASPPYPKPPYMFTAKSGTKSPTLSLKSSGSTDFENLPSTRARSLSGSTTIKSGVSKDSISDSTGMPKFIPKKEPKDVRSSEVLPSVYLTTTTM